MADEQARESTPETDDATGAGGEKPDGRNGGDKDAGERKFTQADLERELGQRLQREKEKAARAAEQARKEATEKALKEQGEWQKLADDRAGEIARLEAEAARLPTLQEQADRYKAALEKHLEAQRKALPKYAIELLDHLDPVDQLAWLARHGDELARANGQAPGGTPNRGGGKSTVPDPSRSNDKQRSLITYQF